MTPEAQKDLVTFFRAARGPLIDHAMAMSEQSPMPMPFTRADMEQMIGGVVVLLIEAAETPPGAPRPIADAFLDGVVNGIMDGGDSIEHLVGSAAGFFAKLAIDAAAGLPPATRNETLPWVLGFTTEWIGRVARTASDAAHAKK